MKEASLGGHTESAAPATHSTPPALGLRPIGQRGWLGRCEPKAVISEVCALLATAAPAPAVG